MTVKIDPSWNKELAEEWNKPYFANLTEFVKQEYATKQVFPPGSQIFAAFDATPFDKVKVVIIGQDPYHEPGQAHGLCFSVNDGVPFPPSLQNIFKEINADTGAPIPTSGNLTRWAQQGVLMLNATLTVQAHKAGSHQGRGWEEFTDAVIAHLSEHGEHLVFILWGSFAIKKGAKINRMKHLVLRRCLPTAADGSATTTSPKPTPTLRNTAKRQSTGSPYCLRKTISPNDTVLFYTASLGDYILYDSDYGATGTACTFFTVPITNTLCTEPIDSISPKRLSTKSW